MTAGLSWGGIVRLGLVQTALGAIVVLTTSTMNRVMVVELMLPAMLPGALVTLHYLVQMLRPRLGHGSDQGTYRTPWIIGGMIVLALGGVGAASATALMATHTTAGITLAVVAFLLIGVGVGAAGTTLLVLLARKVAPARRPAAATIVWLMMIAGFVVTAGFAGHFLDPFSPERLVLVTGCVACVAVLLSIVALWGVERGTADVDADGTGRRPASFRQALHEVFSEQQARRFTLFVFVSMLAYSAQDLILEPFAGTVFGMTPGESTQLAGIQNGGVFLGMLAVAFLANRFGGLRLWTVGGCLASAAALFAIVIGGQIGPGWPLELSVFALGAANGAFAVAAIGSMMGLVGAGHPSREGVRMGVWGAAQAIAFAVGGFLGAAAVDLTRALLASPATAYGIVFAAEGLAFLAAAYLGVWATQGARMSAPNLTPMSGARELALGVGK